MPVVENGIDLEGDLGKRRNVKRKCAGVKIVSGIEHLHGKLYFKKFCYPLGIEPPLEFS